jgi:predicted SAM-dependent methyltransferase
LKISPKLRKIIEAGLIWQAKLLYYPYLVRLFPFPKNQPSRLHIGCGKNHFKGWINADIDPRAELIIFLHKKLPFPVESLDRIYSEHVLEHVNYDTGVFFLKEAHRTLKSGGIIRIAMPDLDDLVDGYQKDWRRFDWVNWKEFAFIKTNAEMINIAFRWWGHKHLYNREELARALYQAGFSKFEFVEHSQSKHDDLRGLETRLDSKLIVEAVKTV